MGQQVGLQLGDTWPVAHVAALGRPLHDGPVGGRQARNRAFQLTDGREVLVKPLLVGGAEARIQALSVFSDSIEDALLALDPAAFFLPEQAIEQPVRQGFRGQGPVAVGPTHVALDRFAKAFLRDADLQRAEAGLPADLRRQHLVKRRPASAASRVDATAQQGAHRRVVAIAGAR